MKITIVGAGPIGCYTAQLLKNYGIDSLLIEEDKEVGRPIQCAGIVGRDVFENLSLRISKASILNQINGAWIYFGKDSFLLKRRGVAYVIDRELFDKELSKGLNIEYNTRFLGLEKKNSKYLIKTDRWKLYSDIIIGADGPNSQVRRNLNLFSNIKFYKGIQFRIKAKPKSRDKVEVHFKSLFFSWVIPEKEDIIRVGSLLKKEEKFSPNFVEELGMSGEILDIAGGLIPMGLCKTVKENIALVGDAACQVKPLTGGGIFYGLKSAEILAKCIYENRLSDYEKEWRKLFGKEILFNLRVRNFLEHTNERFLKSLFYLVKNNSELISKECDFENHSSLFKILFRRFPKILINFFNSLL